MASLNPRTLHLPIDDEVEYIIIDHYGDLLLTLHDPYTVNSPKYPCTFLFQVSSKVLCLTSHYFHQAFQHKWLETTLQADEKYHFSCTGFDAEAMYVLLLTLHKEALYRSDYDYRVTQSLPSEVPLDTLMGMVQIMDYWQTLPASQILQHTSERWFEQFQFKSSRVWNDWDLPDEYGSEIMMWWCLAERRTSIRYQRTACRCGMQSSVSSSKMRRVQLRALGGRFESSSSKSWSTGATGTHHMLGNLRIDAKPQSGMWDR